MRVFSSAALCALVATITSAVYGQKATIGRDDPFPPLADYQVRSYSAIDGLTSTTLTALAQTPDGFLYAATGSGLFRFDSREFVRVELPGFASTLIEDLFLDGRGRLWVRSSATDFAYLENGAVHVLGRVGVTTDGFTSTSDGSVWLTGIQGLVRLTAGQAEWFKVFTHADGLPSDTVAGVYEMPNGEAIVPTTGGLSRLIRDPRAKGGLRFDAVWSIAHSLVNRNYVRNDANGLWVRYPLMRQTIRYHDGIVANVGRPGPSSEDLAWRAGRETLLRASVVSFLRDVDDWVRALKIPPGLQLGRNLVQRDGTRWMDLRRTTRHSELFRLRPSGKLELIDLSGRPEWTVITSMLEDRDGSVWIGTDRGLLQLVKRRVRAVAQREGLPRELIFPVLQTQDGAVWVGTWGEGLFRFAHGALAERMSVALGLPDDRVRSLFESSDGALWVGMRNEAARILRGRVVERIAVHNEVRGFAETQDHVLWIAGAQELVARKPDGQVSRIRTAESIGPAWSIFAEPSGSLLIGTLRGLFRFTAGLNVPTPVAADQGLGAALVTGIFGDQDSSVWVGTWDRGLFRVRRAGVDHLDASAGLPSSSMFLLDDGRGAIWISGLDGLWRVSKDSLHMVADDIAHGRPPRLTLRPVPFRESEGAPGREGNRASPAAWQLQDGRLIFNNSGGLTVVDPTDTLSPRSPRTVVLSVAADGQHVVTSDGRAVLPPQTRRVEIDFATLSFVAPHQHRFQYRLDGFDPDWTEVGAEARTAYTNLRPGRYTFHVRSVKPPGTAWVESEATQVIEVQASWWQTRWFQLGVVVALCAAAYGLHRLSLSKALAINRVRATIASDLHDDLGSSINSIALMTQLLETDAELGGPERDLLSRIQRAAEETAISVRHLVWLVDPTHADLEFLLLRLRRVANDLLPTTDVEFDIAPSTRARPLSMTVTRNVLLIFKEALNNIARHAKATRVEIRVVAQRDALGVMIRDNGAGFDASRVEYGNGVNNMQRRTQELGGELVVETAPGQGTLVLLTVKLP